jgi:hypothetical protein
MLASVQTVTTTPDMSLTDMWRAVRERMVTEKSVPASEVLPRMRESSGAHKALAANRANASAVTPFAAEQSDAAAAAIPPPAWDLVFPGHHRALKADLAKRGDSITNWVIQDGRDMGVSEAGHTVCFTLLKAGTTSLIHVELTMFKGQLGKIRVN